uniref:Alcohol dehydrogenase-like N-terminal domain-containing protein n=1 Tax=Esox lucius TaxID=8010 RepID=A0AAY5KUF6_ESOLU
MSSFKVIACGRQLFLPHARGRALSSSGHTILMGRLKGSLSAFSRLQSNMSAWVIDEYGNNGVLRFTEEATAPSISSGDDVLIRVHAASLNPIDIAMRAGYGSILLKLRRDLMSLGQNASEFPIILGRDVSGVVVDCGSGVTHFTPGDEVWAAVPPWKQGSLAELVSLSEYELSSVSLPYLLTLTVVMSIKKLVRLPQQTWILSLSPNRQHTPTQRQCAAIRT